MGEGIMFYASSLEIIIPVGLFLIISQPNMKNMAVAGIVDIAAGQIMWFMGF